MPVKQGSDTLNNYVVANPEDCRDALIVPLFPLVRREVSIAKETLWVAHNVARNEYRDPASGDVRQFDDELLARWLDAYAQGRTAEQPAARTEDSRRTGRSKVPPRGVGEPPTPGAGSLCGRFVQYVERFYTRPGRGAPAERDATYQLTFEGTAKAQEVIGYLATLRPLERQRLAYVSIGGADGSEAATALRLGGMRRGVLVETSDYGAAKARVRAQELQRDGIEFVVLQGDAMQRLEDCHDVLGRWRQGGDVDGVLLSLQSVLHELPARSPTYDANVLLARVYDGFGTRVFYCREPATPEGWPPVVHLRVAAFPGDVLHGGCRMVRDVLGFEDQVHKLADDYVQLGASLAIETLFKILYCEDAARYRYEMAERVTSFDPERFVRVLCNYVRPRRNIEVSRLVSDTFRELYRRFGVEARAETGEELPIPKPFVAIAGACTGTGDERQ